MFHACPNSDCAVHQAGGLFPEVMPCVLCGTPLAEARIAVDPVSSSGGARTEEEKAIVEGYPYVMALPYSRMLQEPDGRNRLELLAYTLQNALKYMGLLVVGEYHASDLRLPKLNDLFRQNLYQPSFGNWNAFLREGISALEAEGHTWRFPEIGEAYRKVETAKKAKKYPTETTYTDDQGLQAFRKVDGTAIGTLINFRNKYLGHGVPLNREQCAELYAQYKPILDDFLQGLVFAPDLTLVRAERTHLFRLTGTAPEEVDGRQPTASEREKVWVEHSDGRRMELMPFFILPGQVAGVGAESGVLVYEQFTGGKRLVFHGPDSSHGESVGEVLERLKSMIRLKEEEPPIPAEGMTEAVFSQRLAQWNESVMSGLHRERKVIPNLYQPRAEAEQELKGWTGAQAPLLVIAAEAGSGKTNLLAEMARQYGELGLSALLIRAARMESPDLEEVLRGVLNVSTDVDVAALQVLDRPVDAPLMILVDGGNEHAEPAVLMDRLLDFLSRTPRGVKVVLSWRADTPAALPVLDERQARLVYPAAQREGDHILAKSALRLGALDRQEIEGAWDRYLAHPSKAYRPQFDFQKLVEVDRPLTEQFANPLLLRMFMELFHQRGLKHKPKGMADIWALWWRDQRTREREAGFLEAFATLLMEAGESKVPLDALFDHAALGPEVRNIQVDSAYQQLLRRGVLSQSFAGEELEVGFTMEAAWFFVLGEIAGREEWTAEKVAERLAESPRWRAPLQSMVRARVGRGGLDLLCDCIDHEGVPDEFSAEALAQAFMLRNPEEVIEALLADATASDWEVIRMALNWLSGSQKLVQMTAVSEALLRHLEGAPVGPRLFEAMYSRLSLEGRQQLVGMLEAQLEGLVKAVDWQCAADVFSNAGEYSKAEACQRQAADSFRTEMGEESKEYIESLHELAAILSKVGRYEEALVMSQKVLENRRLVLGSEGIGIAHFVYRVGWILILMDRRKEALPYFEESLKLEQKFLGEQHQDTAYTYAAIASAHRGLGNLEEAMEYAQRGHAIEERILPPGASSLGPNHYNMGRICLDMERFDEALDQFKKAEAIFHANLGELHRNTLRNNTYMGQAMIGCGLLDEARLLLERTLQAQRSGECPPHWLEETEAALART